MPNFNKQLQEDLIEQARHFRQNPTPTEAKLWDHLRRKKLANIRFKRQHVIQPYIVDFYCPKAKLVIELDGEIHLEQSGQDQARSKYLEDQDLKVVRFTNDQIENDIHSVLKEILGICQERVE